MISQPAIGATTRAQALNIAYSGLPAPSQMVVSGHEALEPQLSYDTFLSSLSFVMASVVVLAELTRVLRFGRRRVE